MLNVKPEISKSFNSQKNTEFRVDYYVTENVCQSDGADAVPVYGLRLELFENGECTDTSKIDDISPSKTEVTEMAKRFAQNFVTPVTLKDVVEDCISAQFM